MKQKLNAKDFILIGILTALMWIICMIISTIMSVAGPVTNVFYPSVVAIPNGIVMMLLLAKVPKKGVFTICAAIQAILFLLVGAFWFIPIGLVIGGVICDFLIMGRNEITMKSMMAAYALFSAIFAFSAIEVFLRYPAEKNSRLRLALFMRLPQRSTSLMNHRPIWTMPPPNGLLKSWKSSRVPAIPFL